MGVLDAWAYGKPVITTPVGGIPDIAVNNKNCLLFEPGDVDMLSEQISIMIGDISKRNYIAQESSKLSSEMFSTDVIAEELSNIYESLCEQGHP